MAAVLDLHCHTVYGSPDSELTADQLATLARETGLTACCVTEHDKMWDRYQAENYSRDLGISFIRGMEVATDLGHVVVYGLDHYVSGIHDARTLRKTVVSRGGIMIAAHPFRKLFHQIRYGNNGPKPVVPSIDEATRHEIFGLVDEVEVLNGATAELENYFALRVARKLGFRGVAGSDAHSVHGVGRYVTVFHQDVQGVEDLIGAVKAGRFYAAEVRKELEASVTPYTPGSLDPDMEDRLQAAIAVYA